MSNLRNGLILKIEEVIRKCTYQGDSKAQMRYTLEKELGEDNSEMIDECVENYSNTMGSLNEEIMEIADNTFKISGKKVRRYKVSKSEDNN